MHHDIHFISKSSTNALVASTAQDLVLNYRELSIEILKELRGKISQRKLSLDLGYSFNQVGKWESGVTEIKWNDFAHLCDVVAAPLAPSLGLTSPNASDLLNRLRQAAGISTKEEQRVNFPALQEILRELAQKPSLLLGWLSQVMNVQSLTSLQKPYEFFVQNVEIVLANPLVVYVNAALQVQEYKNLTQHNSTLLAEHAGCSVSELKATLENLVECGLVTFDGRKYQPCPFDFSFSSLQNPKLRGLTKYTTQFAAERYPTAPLVLDPSRPFNAARSSVRVAALSAEAAKKVSDLILQFHHQVDEIARQDQIQQLAKENVQVILVHSFPSTVNPPTKS